MVVCTSRWRRRGGRGNSEEGDESSMGCKTLDFYLSSIDTYEKRGRRGSDVRGACGSSDGIDVDRLWKQLALKSRFIRSVLFLPGRIIRGRRRASRADGSGL